jgi:predicted DNA-binding transcriptional regulator YafY
LFLTTILFSKLLLQESTSEALKRFTKTGDDIFLISELARSIDIEIIEDIQDVANRDSDIFFFLNSEFERVEDSKQKLFENLKEAIKSRNYLSITYSYKKIEKYERIKPFRVIFNENNWYLLAVVKSEERGEIVKFFRINFISEMEKHETFQKIEKFENFLQEIQNPFTLYGVEKREAIIEASPKVAIYFREDRKKFLISQKFLEFRNDGSVRFSLQYTQPMEVLPFIKKWLPDLKIVKSPDGELERELKKSVEEALNSYKGVLDGDV